VNKKSWRGRERGIKQIVSKKCVHIKEILLLMDKKDNMLGGIYIIHYKSKHKLLTSVERFVNIINKLPLELQYEVYFHVPRLCVIPDILFNSIYFRSRWERIHLLDLNITHDQVKYFHAHFKCVTDRTIFIDVKLQANQLLDNKHYLLIEDGIHVLHYKIVNYAFTVHIQCKGQIHFNNKNNTNDEKVKHNKWYHRFLVKKRNNKIITTEMSDGKVNSVDHNAIVYAHGNMEIVATNGTLLSKGKFCDGVEYGEWTSYLLKKYGQTQSIANKIQDIIKLGV